MKSIAGASDFSKQWVKGLRDKFDAKNLLEHSEKGRWVTPNFEGGFVVFNLGCPKDFNTIQLAATTSEGWRDRGAKKIIVSVGDSPDGEWTLSLIHI